MKDQSDKIPTTRKLTRREILRGAAAAATAPYVLTGGALGAAGLAPASDRVTVACVGVRNRGGRHLKNLLANGDVEILAVCDVDSVRRDAARPTRKSPEQKPRNARSRGASSARSSAPSRLRSRAAAPPATIPWTIHGGAPKVGGISDASRQPMRPLVPAPI